MALESWPRNTMVPTNQSAVSGQIWTNESEPLWLWEEAREVQCWWQLRPQPDWSDADSAQPVSTLRRLHDCHYETKNTLQRILEQTEKIIIFTFMKRFYIVLPLLNRMILQNTFLILLSQKDLFKEVFLGWECQQLPFISY